MKKTFEDESDALSASPATPTTAQQSATTSPSAHSTVAVPAGRNGTPAYGHLPQAEATAADPAESAG